MSFYFILSNVYSKQKLSLKLRIVYQIFLQSHLTLFYAIFLYDLFTIRYNFLMISYIIEGYNSLQSVRF